MGTEKYDELITRLPEIAKAINEFTSEQVQVRAFSALVSALGITAAPESAEDEGGGDSSPGGTTARKAAPRRKAAAKKTSEDKTEDEGTAKRSPGRRGGGGGTYLKDLDPAPSGRRSLEDLAAASHPKTRAEEILASAYWCAHDAEIHPVTLDHVYTCFRAMGWRLPSDLQNSMSVASNRKGWFTSTSRDDIVISSKGLNFIERTMMMRTDEKS